MLAVLKGVRCILKAMEVTPEVLKCVRRPRSHGSSARGVGGTGGCAEAMKDIRRMLKVPEVVYGMRCV